MNFKNCSQRSITYETKCETCKSGKYKRKGGGEENKEKNEENKSEKEEKKRKKDKEDSRKGPLYRYIGESARSTFERGSEHLADLKNRRVRSHMLRHCVELHPEENPDEIDFRMRQLKSHRSAFERQLFEAVLIEEHNGPLLMNSRIEYNRCYIPKIQMKSGNGDDKPDIDKEKETSTREKIRMLYKGENKREKPDHRDKKKGVVSEENEDR